MKKTRRATALLEVFVLPTKYSCIQWSSLIPSVSHNVIPQFLVLRFGGLDLRQKSACRGIEKQFTAILEPLDSRLTQNVVFPKTFLLFYVGCNCLVFIDYYLPSTVIVKHAYLPIEAWAQREIEPISLVHSLQCVHSQGSTTSHVQPNMTINSLFMLSRQVPTPFCAVLIRFLTHCCNNDEKACNIGRQVM